MNRFLSLLIFCLSYLLLLGCGSLRNEVDPQRLNKDAGKLVVNCFLSPQDTILAASVNRSATVLNDGSPGATGALNVVDATVTLSQGSSLVVLRYDIKRSMYTADAQLFPIVANQSYTLEVQTPNGERAKSTCTIPPPIEKPSLLFDSTVVNQFGIEQRQYFVQARWQDLVGQPNFYQLTGSFQFVYNYSPPNDTIFRQESYPIYLARDNNDLITDSGIDGSQLLSKKANLPIYYFSNPSTGTTSGFMSQYKSGSLTINLLNTDETYYQYQDAVGRQQQVSGNPFTEPVPIPSNIQGGLGCFAGYNRSTFTLKLK